MFIVSRSIGCKPLIIIFYNCPFLPHLAWDLEILDILRRSRVAKKVSAEGAFRESVRERNLEAQPLLKSLQQRRPL